MPICLPLAEGAAERTGTDHVHQSRSQHKDHPSSSTAKVNLLLGVERKLLFDQMRETIAIVDIAGLVGVVLSV